MRAKEIVVSGRLRVLLLLCCFCAFGVQAEEAIQAYDVRVQVEPNGEVLVTERIAVIAEGRAIVRGIFRDIPTRYSLGKGLLRNTPLTLISVTRDGRPENVAQQTLDHGIRLRLGSADTLLEPGPYVYELTYRMNAQLLHHASADELYWNVTGNDWQLPIRAVSVEVVLPEGAQIQAAHGYTGYKGSRDGDYEVIEQEGNRLRLVTNRELRVQEGFTVAVAWQAGLVARPGWWAQLRDLYLDNSRLILFMATFAGLVLFYVRLWWTLGRGPAKGLIIPLFELGKGVSPIMAGYVWRRGVGMDKQGVRALSIMFTDLAIRGLLRLERDSKGLLLRRGDVSQEELREEERRVLDALFVRGEDSLLLQDRYEPRMGKALASLRQAFERFEQANFNTHTGQWRVGAFFASIAGAVLFFSGLDGYEGSKTDALLTMLVATAMVIGVFFSLTSGAVAIGLFLSIFALVMLVIVGGQVGGGVVLGCVLLTLVVLIARKTLRAPSNAGRRLLDELEGYRSYLSLAESETLATAGNAPVMSIALYERHLPYAMALGVEAQWTRRFTRELEKGALAPVDVTYQAQGFTHQLTSGETQTLAWSLDRMLMSASVPPQAPRSSDDFSRSGGGGSGSSASRGGGSSGGGAGGGGGGGW